jgi:hypothetical protein
VTLLSAASCTQRDTSEASLRRPRSSRSARI